MNHELIYNGKCTENALRIMRLSIKHGTSKRKHADVAELQLSIVIHFLQVLPSKAETQMVTEILQHCEGTDFGLGSCTFLGGKSQSPKCAFMPSGLGSATVVG